MVDRLQMIASSDVMTDIFIYSSERVYYFFYFISAFYTHYKLISLADFGSKDKITRP